MTEPGMIEGGRPLRCQLCGGEIGQVFGDEPSKEAMDLVTMRCYSCAAVEEAEAILKRAAGGEEPDG